MGGEQRREEEERTKDGEDDFDKVEQKEGKSLDRHYRKYAISAKLQWAML